MTLRKRFRILLAALTQRWAEYHCACGETGYCSVAFHTPSEVCNACEDARYERWRASR